MIPFFFFSFRFEEVGRYVCDVRICSCPGRDIKNEEEKIVKNSNDDNETSTANNIVRIELPSVDSKGKTKKRKIHPLPPPPAVPNPLESDNEIYNLNINVNVSKVLIYVLEIYFMKFYVADSWQERIRAG